MTDEITLNKISCAKAALKDGSAANMGDVMDMLGVAQDKQEAWMLEQAYITHVMSKQSTTYADAKERFIANVKFGSDYMNKPEIAGMYLTEETANG